ncbi:MAG TPA: hypothetical protein VOB72_02080, partial [Candidatus Dormibacteraeota bacterium]|nr:hypothetical protein [Candidatus Dormibacteraeota bacterium]
MSRIVVAGAGGGGIAALGRLVGPGADGMLAVAVDSDPSVLDRCAAVRIDAGAGSRARLAEVL